MPQSDRFAQSKNLLFWSCLNFPDFLCNFSVALERDKRDDNYKKDTGN